MIGKFAEQRGLCDVTYVVTMQPGVAHIVTMQQRGHMEAIGSRIITHGSLRLRNCEEIKGFTYIRKVYLRSHINFSKDIVRPAHQAGCFE